MGTSIQHVVLDFVQTNTWTETFVFRFDDTFSDRFELRDLIDSERSCHQSTETMVKATIKLVQLGIENILRYTYILEYHVQICMYNV